MSRLSALTTFYGLLENLAPAGGFPLLAELRPINIPLAGVYFFFEPGERRSDSGSGLRVVRVGTHAITETSATTLWMRVKQHRGNDKVPGGHHRGSIFRLLIGDAMQRRDAKPVHSWGVGGTATREIRVGEQQLEVLVSAHLRTMRVLLVQVPDRANRRLLETASIALLSNYQKAPLDQHSTQWLGRYSSRSKVCESGLWNNRDVNAPFDARTIEVLRRCVPFTPTD
jgi:hypothetical protein